MNILQALVLGIVQGITEFLPISSSGHLVLGKALLGVHTEGVAFEVFVHFGTFLAVLTIFWGDIWNILKAWGHALHHAIGLCTIEKTPFSDSGSSSAWVPFRLG